MPVILLAHRDPQLRASLGTALTARGFEVIGVDSIDTALDAAAAGATGLLVELQLLADEDLEVKTRLDLRSGRPTRILALTHKASAEEMSMLKRHGAGLLSRAVEDVDRMASMLRIQEEAPAPWEESKKPPVAKPASASKPIASAPKAQPSNIVPPPAPAPIPAPVVAAPPPPPPPPAPAPTPSESPAVAAPWDDSASSPPPPSSAPSSFKPAPAQFMPPDLSKSVAAAPSTPEAIPPKPLQPLPPPSQFVPPPTAPPTAPAAVPAAATPAALAMFDDAATAIGAPFPPAPPLAPPPSAANPLASMFAGDGPLQVPDDLFEKTEVPIPPAPTISPLSPLPPSTAQVIAVPTAAPPPPPQTSPKGAFTWSDDTEDELAAPAPKISTDVFRDEAEEPTNAVKIPGMEPPAKEAISRAVAEALADEEKKPTAPAAKGPPKFEVEVEPGSKTQVIPDLAASAIPARPSADPFVAANAAVMDTVVPDLSNISANVSDAWFADSNANANGSEKGESAGTGPVVLVVEDEPAFRTFLKEALGSQGYRVHTAINGPNALRFLKATPGIDLVIADLHMPHMDGFELKHEIDQCLGRPMPFIVCTADANDEKIQVAAQVGAAALVPKPIENLDAFFAIVTDTLKDAGVIARTA